MPIDHLGLSAEPSSAALTSRDTIVTFAQLHQRVGQIAAQLQARGFERGARIATWLPKTIEACMLPLAVARAGLVHVPVNPALRKAQVEHILADSGASLLITSASRAGLLEADVWPVWLEAELQAEVAMEPLPPSDADPDELAAILYTSGSTGRPKGVMLSHANLWLGAVSVAHYLEIAPEDRVLAVLPLSFDYGQNQLFSSWHAGACVTPLDYLTARDVMKAVARHDITTLAGVPPLWVQLVEADWSADSAARLKRLTNSGGALTPSLIAAMRRTFPHADIYPMYGLTEAFRSTYLDPALVDAHPTSIGTAIPFAEIMIVDAQGQECRAGEPGELVHAGPLVAQGYWRDAARTAERFKPAPAHSHYGGMAVWSGDKARRDEAGLLTFIGRDDEMIKSSGNRISPTEIEEVALASGAVLECVALGAPDPRLGQAIVLIAVARGAADETGLRSWFKAELPAFMQPRDIVWLDSLPRNPNGKLDRSALKQEYAA